MSMTVVPFDSTLPARYLLSALVGAERESRAVRKVTSARPWWHRFTGRSRG
jgi:hypothetical protein